MEEKEIVALLYRKYGKWELKLPAVSREINKSYSKTSKYFGGKNSYTDKFIKKHKLLPIWEQPEGEQRRWNILEIAKWICRTEVKYD